MKKIFKLFIFLLVAFALVACGEPENNAGSNNDDTNQPETPDTPKTPEVNPPVEEFYVSYVVTSGDSVGPEIKFSYVRVDNNYQATISNVSGMTSISFFLDGELLDSSNVTVTGDFSATDSSAALYHDGDSTVFLKGSNVVSYTFAYSEKNNTLSVKAKIKLNINSIASFVVDVENMDAGAEKTAVWTTSGYKLRECLDDTTGAWQAEGNGWRLYIICDAEGKICYLVENFPSGFGGYGDESFYCHSSFIKSEFTQSPNEDNPAFNVHDGWANWYKGGWEFNLYDILIPEGGFAITVHGETIREVLRQLGATEDIISSALETDAVVNNRNLLVNNTHNVDHNLLRLAYDAEEGKVLVYLAE